MQMDPTALQHSRHVQWRLQYFQYHAVTAVSLYVLEGCILGLWFDTRLRHPEHDPA